MIMKPFTNEILPQGYKMTELGALPEEWEVVRLGDVAKKMKAGGTPRRGIKEYWGGNIPFVLIEDMTSGGLYLSKTKETITEKGLNNSSAWLVPSNTLLLSMYATIGETAINTIPLATNQAILAIMAKDNFSIVFGAYLLKYSTQRLIMQNIQSTQKNVNKGIVENFKIPLPPLPEQQKIAAVLSAVQEAKEKTEAVIAAAKALKKSIMKHLFTYGPVSPQDAENVPLKETEIGPVPKDWEVARLENIFRITSGKARPKILKESPAEPYLFPVFGGNGIIGYSNEFLIEYPTIILGRVGEYCGSAHISQGKCWVSDNALYANYFKKKIDLKFLLNALEILNLNKLKNRGGQPLISQSVVYSQSISLPPLPTQQKIASILSAIDAKIETEENKKKALEELFKALLHNLMTAKIRVNNLEFEDV